MRNATYPDMVKIGMTYNSPHVRAQQLSSTGVRHSFKVFGYVEVENPENLESKVKKVQNYF